MKKNKRKTKKTNLKPIQDVSKIEIERLKEYYVKRAKENNNN